MRQHRRKAAENLAVLSNSERLTVFLSRYGARCYEYVDVDGIVDGANGPIAKYALKDTAGMKTSPAPFAVFVTTARSGKRLAQLIVGK